MSRAPRVVVFRLGPNAGTVGADKDWSEVLRVDAAAILPSTTMLQAPVRSFRRGRIL
jgi:hypothetical protein